MLWRGSRPARFAAMDPRGQRKYNRNEKLRSILRDQDLLLDMLSDPHVDMEEAQRRLIDLVERVKDIIE